MNALNSLKKFGLVLAAMTVMLTAANAQQRYKHMPRVKIDKKQVETASTKETINNHTTTAQITTAEENVAVNEATTPVIENNSTVASTENVVVTETKTKSVVNHKKSVKTNKKADFTAFTQKVKENSKLMDVKDTKKSNLERWLLYMIICIAVAVLFTILAAALAYTFVLSGAYALVIVFWIIAGIAWIGALVFLILGLAGVM